MFAYVEIIDEQGKTTYNYVNFEISDGLLSIKPLKGMLPVHLSVIPISQIKDISENKYYGWNTISFTHGKNKYVFTYSGFGGEDYLREHLLAVMID